MKLFAFAGSARTESLNKKLAQISAELIKTSGVEVTFLDLQNYPLPLYDGDYEEEHGQPENANKLCELMQAH